MMMMMMMKGLLLLLIIFLIFLAQGEAKPPPSQYLVKPNCQAECGKVVIPYPFGIGKNCYMNDWYSVDCRKAPGRHTRPFLNNTRLNLELVYVSLIHQTVTVKSPIASYHPQDTTSSRLQPSFDLGGSPFVFSRLDNKFAVLGCGNVKLMTDDGRTLAGCASLCSGGHRNDPGCYGIGCCQTSIPSRESYYLNTYNVSFTPEDEGNGSSSGPIHAFLVESDWLSRRFMEPEEVSGMNHVPLSLFWFLKKGDNSSRHPDCNGTTLIYNPDSESYIHYTCSCPLRYEGNPYLRDGCHVVKECVNCLKTCHYNYHFNTSSYRGSYDLTYHCPKRNKKDRPRPLILGFSISGGSILLVFGCLWLCKFVKKQKEIRRKRRFFKQNGGLLLEQQISSDEVSIEKAKIFTSKELEMATDNFSLNRVLGQGGQGKVYKGMLPDGKIIAIKKSMVVDKRQIGHFINEIVILSQINHRNIVRILGCCLETEVPLLVYEFIPNGTLFQYIHNQDTDYPLSWKKRLQVATEVAEALFYLHSACSIPIYHRDVKSTNILLDDKYRAKVSDFGTSRSISIGQTHLTTHVQGTSGYLDPEYFQSSHFTEKSDVYSFGVVLAELLTGQKPICLSRPDEEKSLVMHFNLAIEESRLSGILDAIVAKEGGEEEVKAVADLAHRCLNMSRRKRPTMKEVSVELERIRVLSLPPLMEVDEQNLEENASMVMGITESLQYGTSPFAGPPNGGASSSSTRSCLLRRTTSSEEQQLLFNTI